MGIKKPAIIGIAVAAVIAIGGGVATAATIAASTPTSAPGTAEVAGTDAPQTTSEAPATEAPDLSAKTEQGEVCDPHNLNDTICAAFYPDLAVLNMTLSPRAGEPLASLPDDQRIALAHQACEQLAAGAGLHGVNVIDTAPADTALGRDNNYSLASAGALAYCNGSVDSDDIKWTLEQYKSMGEEAAKESFAGGVVIHR